MENCENLHFFKEGLQMRKHNFTAGPAALPLPVLEQIKADLPNWNALGASVMEISHRSSDFAKILNQAESNLRELLGVPDDYAVLFLQGGALLQFSVVPMNLACDRSADFIITGAWSQKAFAAAQKINPTMRIAATTESSGFTTLPTAKEIQLNPNAAYLHLCTNETIHGVEIAPEQLAAVPMPVVADMSSHILSRPCEVNKFGVIYAGAQKNIGPSGLTLVIIRRDLLGLAPLNTPNLLDYAQLTENHSMLNTPPTFAIYVANLVFEWLKNLGGVKAIDKINAQKAEKLYRTIDESGGFYINKVEKSCRSRMNVPFLLKDERLNDAFLKESLNADCLGLKGHQSVGGFRASLYNAVSFESVSVLCEFMQDFAKRKA